MCSGVGRPSTGCGGDGRQATGRPRQPPGKDYFAALGLPNNVVGCVCDSQKKRLIFAGASKQVHKVADSWNNETFGNFGCNMLV